MAYIGVVACSVYVSNWFCIEFDQFYIDIVFLGFFMYLNRIYVSYV